MGIEIDGKTYEAEDIKNLLAQQAEATKKTQQVSAVLKAAQRLDMTPEELVQRSEGMVAVLNNLVDAGIIDENGNPVKKDPQTPSPRQDPPPRTPNNPGSDDAATKALETISSQIENMSKEFTALKDENTVLRRGMLQLNMRQRFPDLSDREIPVVLGRAKEDSSKGLEEHVKDYLEEKNKSTAEQREALIADYRAKGIDLTALEEAAKRKAELEKEGARKTIVGEKKIKFGHRIEKDEKDGAVSPIDAAREFLNSQES